MKGQTKLQNYRAASWHHHKIEDYDAGHTGFDATRQQDNLNTADMLAFALWHTGDPNFQPKVATTDQQ